MGACGSGLLERLGPEFGKFVACEKGKVFVDEKVLQIKNTLYSKSDQVKNKTLAQINSSQTQAIGKLKQTVKDMDSQNPGVLDQAAGLLRKTKQELLGADDIKSKFNEARTEVQNKFKQQEKNILSQIDNQAINQKKYLDSQRPTIPIYDQLPQAQQKKVFEEGEKKFADQIKSQQDSIKKQLESKLDISKYTQIFNSTQVGDISNLSKQADSILAAAKSAVAPSPFSVC